MVFWSDVLLGPVFFLTMCAALSAGPLVKNKIGLPPSGVELSDYQSDPEAEAVERFADKSAAAFMQKPYSAEQLTGKIRSVLQENAAPAL